MAAAPMGPGHSPFAAVGRPLQRAYVAGLGAFAVAFAVAFVVRAVPRRHANS